MSKDVEQSNKSVADEMLKKALDFLGDYYERHFSDPIQQDDGPDPITTLKEFQALTKLNAFGISASSMCPLCDRGDPVQKEDEHWWHYRTEIGKGVAYKCEAEPIQKHIAELIELVERF